MKKSFFAILIVMLATLLLFAACNSDDIVDNTDEVSESADGAGESDASECEHNFSAWKVKTKATCIREGSEERRCSKCRVVEKRAVAMLQTHDVLIDRAVEPTCVNTGLSEGSHCVICNKVIQAQEILPIIPTAHSYETEKIVATHNAQGYYLSTCTRCNDSYKADFFDFVPTESLVYKNNDDGTCVVSGVSDTTAEEINIPEISPDGYIVTGIAARAFTSNQAIKTIVAPESVTYVDERAFDGCGSLSYAFVPGVEKIENYAFSSCASLKSIIYSDSMTKVGEKAFYGCRALKECRAKSSSKNLDTIISFGYMAFSMSGITNPTFSANLTKTSLANSPFMHCKSLGCIDLSAATLESLGGGFQNTSFTEFIFPQGITNIPPYAFAGCYFKTIIIPDSVIKIEYNSFFGADFDKVVFGSGVKIIGSQTFEDSHGEIDLTPATKLEDILYRAFANSDATTLIIPASVTYIDNAALAGCNNLRVLGIPFISISDDQSVYSTNCFGAIFSGNAESFTQEKYIPESLEIVIITADSVDFEYGDFNSDVSLSVLVVPKNITFARESLVLSLKSLYFLGDESEMPTLDAAYGDTKPTVYYYSESAPTASGNYWHYVDGVPTAW